MTIESWPVTDRESWLKRREKDVTASVAAALFGDGVHPYITAYELYCLKAGLIEADPEETPAMRRGRLLEPVALQLLREERYGWTLEAGKTYYRDTVHRIGATPDTTARRPDIDGLGTVQIKTAGRFAFDKGWKGEHGEINLPLWIAVQCSVEASLIGATWGAVAVMVLGDGGLDMHIVDVPLRPKLVVKLRELTKEFWRRVGAREAYPIEFNRDAEMISRLYAETDGGTVDLSANNRIMEVIAAREGLKIMEAKGAAAAKERKPLDAEIIAALGNAANGTLADGRVIEAPTVHRKEYSVEATSYRTIRVKDYSAKLRRSATYTGADQEGPF